MVLFVNVQFQNVVVLVVLIQIYIHINNYSSCSNKYTTGTTPTYCTESCINLSTNANNFNECQTNSSDKFNIYANSLTVNPNHHQILLMQCNAVL